MELGLLLDDIKTHTCTSTDMPGGIAHYVPESFSLLAEAAVLFAKSESSSDTRVMFSAGYGYGRHLNTCCCFNSKGMRNDSVFQSFASLPGRVPHCTSSQTVSEIEGCEVFAGTNRQNARSLNATFTIRPDLALITDIHQIWLDTSNLLEHVDGQLFSIGFSPLTSAKQLDCKAGEDLLFTVMVSSTWKLPADDERVRSAIDTILAKSWAMSRERNLQNGSVFADYAHYSGSVLNDFGKSGTAFLR